MKRPVLTIFFILLSTIVFCQVNQYKFGKPSSQGIITYVKTNEERFKTDYQKLIGDTIYNDVYITTADFKKSGIDIDKHTLAYNTLSLNYSGSCEITIDNRERYTDYDYNTIKNKDSYNEYSYFVTGTVYHEITHYYIQQLMAEMQESISVSHYYKDGIVQFPNIECQYGAKFIEEGICEYIKCLDSPKLSKDYTPESLKYFIDNRNSYEVLYCYAMQFVRDYLDCCVKTTGRPRNAIMVLLHNKPPDYEEILCPKKYFNRLTIY